MPDLIPLDAIRPDDLAAVGGKGLNLGRLAAAGLPVPPGFCVSTDASRHANGQPLTPDSGLGTAIAAAYRQLGGGPVAVRSSATAEDSADASFAGQQETVLGVTGEPAVLDAVRRCWDSLQGERARAYRQKQGVDERGLAMAVVVQRLVPAEVAGVLFTRDPLDADGRRMLVEASWGLGESVVSGRVEPDRFHLDRASGEVLDRRAGSKRTELTADGPRDVPPERQSALCLTDTQLAELADLGRRVEALYGDARDIEWAYAEDQFWLLQARPITTAAADEREGLRRRTIDDLRAKADPRGTVWSRFNPAEILTDPTPMTWAVLRRFLSGSGGYGLMYRDLGYPPAAELADECVYDLIGGRAYCNLSRQPRMQFAEVPFEYSYAALKADPDLALNPQMALNPWRDGVMRGLMRLPKMFWRVSVASLRMRNAAGAFADTFRDQTVPAFRAEFERGAEEDLAKLDAPALVDRLEHWTRRTLIDFARDSLKPTALAEVSVGLLRQELGRSLGPERAEAAVAELAQAARLDPDTDPGTGVSRLRSGRLTRAEFLGKFGHRGHREMELAAPRWSEDAGAVDRLLAGGGREPVAGGEPSSVWERVADEAKLAGSRRSLLGKEHGRLLTFVALREGGKHELLRGYALIRRVLVELDRRHGLGGGIFYLSPGELPALVRGEDLTGRVAQRRRERALALGLEVPPVVFSDDLEAVGRPVPPPAGAEVLKGVPLSAGVAEGPALVLEEPTAPPEGEPFVLVCPTTDPAWVPLFARACGLVMETGGVLSHGAIVAREFGLPAVAGLPGVQRRLRTGQRVRVDGARGEVAVLTKP
jgi:pyruvate,water dikinase